MDQGELPPPKGGFKIEAKKWYNLGVLKGCPHQTLHVGLSNGYVVTFTQSAETVMLNRETRMTERSKRRGDFCRLSEEEVVDLRAKIKRKIVRWTSRDNSRGYIVNMDDKRYPDGVGFVQEPSDEPLGRYLFLKEVPPDAVEAVLNPMGSEGESMAPEEK